MMRHTLGIVAAQAVRTLAPLITLPLISRSTSLSEFGLYAFFLTLAQAASVVIDFGFSFTGYALAEKARDGRALFARLTIVRLSIGLIVGAVMVAATYLFAPQSTGLAIAGAAYAIALGCSPLWYMNWRRESGWLVTYESLPVIAMVSAAALTYFVGLPPMFVLLAGAVGGLVGPLRISLPVWLSRETREVFDGRSLMMGQLGVALGRLVVVAYTVAIIPLGTTLGLANAVGHYAAVEKLGSVMGVLGIVVAQWMAPQIASLNGTDASRSLIRRIIVLAVALPAIVAVPLALGGGTLVAAVFGPNFQALDAGAAVVVVGSVLGYWTTLIWSGAALPAGLTRGYLGVMALGAFAAVLAMLAFSSLDYLALCLSRLGAELAVLLVSLAVFAPGRWRVKKSA